MSNSILGQWQHWTAQKRDWTLWADVAFDGSSGATLNKGSQGIASVAYVASSTHELTITFKKPFTKVLGVSVVFSDTGGTVVHTSTLLKTAPSTFPIVLKFGKANASGDGTVAFDPVSVRALVTIHLTDTAVV